MNQNFFFTSLKFVLIELIGDILYWPIWWYSKGTLNTALFCLDQIKKQEEFLGLSIWVKNIFTPMFGQYDWEGRIISFFARLVQIIFRAIFMLVWIILIIIILISWLLLPIFIGYQIIINFLYLFG